MFKGDNWHISSFETDFNVAFFTDTVKARSFKLCVIITLLRVYIFMAALMTLTLFEGHSCVRYINCKVCFSDCWLDSCPLQFKCRMVLHLRLSLTPGGGWDTTDDFVTSFLHFSLVSTALWDLANSRPVRSQMLSSHLFFFFCFLPPFTVPFMFLFD